VASSSKRSIPVTILAGSDRKPGALPESGAGLHPLASYKGVTVRVDGRPILALLVERVAAAEGFGPVAVAGPARLLEPLGLEASIVDTDGSVATNLRAAIEAHRARAPCGSAGSPMAVLACDVLPTALELSELRARFEADDPCALWFPFVRVPEEADDPGGLGAFAWKPAYRFLAGPGERHVRILPGHLGIFAPGALRLPLVYRLLDSAYRTRNRSVAYRRIVMLATVALSLLAQDAKLLSGLHVPDRTATVVSNGLRLASRLRRGTLRLAELEHLIGRIVLRTHAPDGRTAWPGGVRFPIVDLVRLAEDVDTEEEARAIEREVQSRRPEAGRTEGGSHESWSRSRRSSSR